MSETPKQGLYFIPLGGADEIGMNMYAYGSNGKWIVVDAGYGFLNDDYPGMDMCYASADFFDDYKDDIEGLFITHAHEDHMGAVAHIWPHLKCPVYGTPFALKLIEERLAEYQMEQNVPLKSVMPSETVCTTEFEVRFIALVHSVVETCGLFIKTAYGNVFHATDWRFDDHKLEMLPTGYADLEQAAQDGVTMFVCDSTNVCLEKRQPSEYNIRQSLMEKIPQIKGGLIATCFASNIMRLESLILAADQAGRTPILIGRTLKTNIKAAKECGYLKDAPRTYTPETAQGITNDKALYICTGSQANYRSALRIIANGESKYVKLSKDDTIIFSSKIIPGNEEKIEHMQEQMLEQGVHVMTTETDLVHTTGHASKEELKKMYEILKPQIVFPVHGDKRFIREHKRFALSCGIDQVESGQNGDVFKILNGKIFKEEELCCDIMGVDRGRSVSLNSKLVQNRKKIAYNCSLFVSIVVDSQYKLKDFQISSLDILEEDDFKLLAEKIKEKLTPTIESILDKQKLNKSSQENIRSKIRKAVYSATDIKPVTILHIYQEN